MKNPKKRILVLVETSRIYGRQIIEGITRYAFENGNWVVFLEDRGFMNGSIESMDLFQCDGIISRSIDSKQVAQVERSGIPAVELLGDGKLKHSDVLCDSEILGRMAADYFLQKNLKGFAFFSTGHSWWSEQFCNSYCRAVVEAGFSCNVTPICEQGNDASLPVKMQKDLEEKTIAWLRSLPKPTGLFCPSDSQAIFLLNLCQIAGIIVPNELFVLGVENNATLCNATSPPLSSIAVDGFQTGYQAAMLLEKKMNGEPLPTIPIRIPPIKIVTRKSTDAFAVSDPDVVKALHLISQHSHSPITVKMIAKEVGVSVRTLIRKFQETLNRNPEDEIIRTRMERAKALLAETDLSVASIAKNIGYASREYFIRVFRSRVDMTPQQYRKLAQSHEDETAH